MAKYALLRDRIARDLPAIQLCEAPAATEGELALAHHPDYISKVLNGTLSESAQREIGFPWSAAMVERSRRSVGATIAACRAALAGQGVSANLAGGTHHAYGDKGSGFCVFNDTAVAARLMQAEVARRASASGISRTPMQVAVVDLDVHQGNGTASIFRSDPTVFTLSLHGEKNFPFRKEASDLDVELPDGCLDDAYLEALTVALDTLGQQFEPDLLIYLAGADIFEHDRLGRLKITADGMEARDRQVFAWAWQRRIPLAFSMAGGYGHRIDETVAVQFNTYRVALEYARRWQALEAASA